MVLFRAIVEVDKHIVKKNSKSAFFDKRTGKAWVTRSKDAINAQNYLEKLISVERNRQLHGAQIEGDIQVSLIFHFKDFYTKKMKRSEKLPDLDNLLCLPLDALVKAGIIRNDSQVCSLDGSRRKPSSSNKLEIIIQSYG